MSGLPRVTDVSIQFVGEHTLALTHLQISGCDRVSLDAVHVILRRLTHLEYFGASIPAMSRVGTDRFSEAESPVRTFPLLLHAQ